MLTQAITLRITTNRIGAAQFGFLTTSSNVALGEKKTPKIRPIGLMAAGDCASGVGRDVVAIKFPPPQGLSDTAEKKLHSAAALTFPFVKFFVSAPSSVRNPASNSPSRQTAAPDLTPSFSSRDFG